MKPVVVRNVAIGEAIPKICVPIVGKTIDEILNQAKHICEIGADVVEWRVDLSLIHIFAHILRSNLYSTDARNIYPELKPVAAEIDGIHLG